MTDEIAQNESNHSTDVCANCGERIDTKEWHAVTARTDDDGTVEIVPFCDEDCRDTWETERSDEA